MSFEKYPSIENHYRNKEITHWLNHHPELSNEVFIGREKLDGSNLAVYFIYDQKKDDKLTIKFASRNNFIGYYGEDVRFQGEEITKLFNSNNAYIKFINRFSELVKTIQKDIIVFGELYGKLTRVKYRDRGWRAFDIKIDGSYISQIEFEEMMNISGLTKEEYESLICPFVAKFNSLKDAIEFNVEFDSLLTPEGFGKPNNSEGIVIKPYKKVYSKECGSVFILKKKSEKFKDSEKTEKPKKVIDENLASLNLDFRSYINENRIIDIYSKYGEIEKPSQIGQYIIWTLEDAKADFFKDHPDYKGNKDDDKVVFNVGGMIVNMLKEKL